MISRFLPVFLCLFLFATQVHARQVSTSAPVDKTVKKMILSYEEGKPFMASFRTLVALGPSANPTLLKLGDDKSLEMHQRWTAIRAVGRIGDHQAVAELANLLDNEHPIIRIAALRALGDLGGKEVTKDIIQVAENDDAMVVRSTAVQVLGQLKATEAIPTLEKTLSDERNFMKGQSLFIRKHAVIAMGQVQAREATPILIKVLDDKDQVIPAYAVQSLQRITGLKFEAKNQSTVNSHWKSWWEKELQRIPQLPAAQSESSKI